MVPKCTINKAQGRIQTSVLDQGKYFLNKSRLPAKGRQDLLESQAKKSDMKTLNIFSPVKRSFITAIYNSELSSDEQSLGHLIQGCGGW